MTLRLSLVCFLMASSVCAFSQTKTTDINNLSDDMGFYVGAYVPMYKGQEADVTLGLTYGYFNTDGLGYRAGFQYTYRVAEIDNSIGFPVAFAYRTKALSSEGRLRRGAIAAGETFGYEAIMGYRDPLRGALASFIANLFSQMEFFVGATPGYISGESTPVSTAWYKSGADNIQENTWTERNGNFSLFLDAGACANYRIWRFDLKLSPAFHYNLTRNYVLHTDTITFENGSDVGFMEPSEKALRWFFSMTAGLSFRF